MPNPDAWIIESKAGIWLTTKPEIAAKHDNKPGTIITPYFSNRVKEIEPNGHQTGLGPGGSAGGNEAVPPVEAAA